MVGQWSEAATSHYHALPKGIEERLGKQPGPKIGVVDRKECRTGLECVEGDNKDEDADAWNERFGPALEKTLLQALMASIVVIGRIQVEQGCAVLRMNFEVEGVSMD